MISKNEGEVKEIPHLINWIYFGPKIFDETGEIRESFRTNIAGWITVSPQATFKLWINKDELNTTQQSTLMNYAATFPGKLQIVDQRQSIDIVPEIADETTIQHKIYQLFLLELTHPKGNYAAASDLFRLLILYHQGGIYSDLDVSCIYHLKEHIKAPLDLLVYFSKFIIKKNMIHGDMSNCVIAAPPHSPVIMQLFKTILGNYLHDEKKYGSIENYFASRNHYELMNTSGSDAYRTTLVQRNSNLFFKIQPQYFTGQQCFDLDFLTQSVDLENVALQIESGKLETSMSKEELSTLPLRRWDIDLTKSLLNSTFEKAWLQPKQILPEVTIELTTNPTQLPSCKQ